MERTQQQQPLEAAPAQADERETRGAQPIRFRPASWRTTGRKCSGRRLRPAKIPATGISDAVRGAGSQIPHREEMERAFGEDFSNVKAYPGQAAPMAALGARAATRKDKVAFAGDSPDRHTVAHELTHVVQTRKNGAAASSGVSREQDASEREAEAIAPRAAAGQEVQVHAAPSAGTHLLRDEDEKTLRDRFTASRPAGAIDAVVTQLRIYVDTRSQPFVEQGDLQGMFKEIDEKLQQETKEDLKKLVTPIVVKHFNAYDQAAAARRKEEKAAANAQKPTSISEFLGISPTPIRAMFKGRVLADGVNFYQSPTFQFGDKEQPAPLNVKLEKLTKDQVISVDEPEEGLKKNMKGAWYRATAQVGSEHIDGFVRKQDVEVQAAPELKSCAAVPLFRKEGPKPEDIRQQQLGDCFLIAAMAAISAKCPGEIEKRMQEGVDTVAVTLFDKGGTPDQPTFTARTVTVDKSLWVDTKTGAHVYAADGGHEPLWTAILEKAYAAFQGRPALGFKGIDKEGTTVASFRGAIGPPRRERITFAKCLGGAAKKEPAAPGGERGPVRCAGACGSAAQLHAPSENDERGVGAQRSSRSRGRRQISRELRTAKRTHRQGSGGADRAEPGPGMHVGAVWKGTTSGHGILHASFGTKAGLRPVQRRRGGALSTDSATPREGGSVVCLSTKGWGEGGTGLSGGENTTEVPGPRFTPWLHGSQHQRQSGRERALLRQDSKSLGTLRPRLLENGSGRDAGKGPKRRRVRPRAVRSDAVLQLRVQRLMSPSLDPLMVIDHVVRVVSSRGCRRSPSCWCASGRG